MLGCAQSAHQPKLQYKKYVGPNRTINAAYRFYAYALPQIAYDPDKARYHFKKSGVSDNVFDIFVSNTPFAGAVDTAVLMQQHARKAGITIRVNQVPHDGYWSDTWKKNRGTRR